MFQVKKHRSSQASEERKNITMKLMPISSSINLIREPKPKYEPNALMIKGLNIHNNKMSTKKENIIIDLLEDSVIASRIFENIEKVMNCCDLIMNSWYPIVYLMGIDLDKVIQQNEHLQNEYLQDQYLSIFEMYIKKENTNRDTAVLVYKKFDDLIKKHLKEFPYLKAS